MASFTFTINAPNMTNAQLVAWAKPIAIKHGWTEQVVDPDTGEMVSNPVTLQKFMNDFIIMILRKERKRIFVPSAAQEAQQTKIAEEDAIIIN